MIDVPFLYTVIHAFLLVLRYEGKRNIKIDDLFKYRDEVLDRVLDDYYNNSNPAYKQRDIWEGEVEFCQIDKMQELNNVIELNPDLFYLENDEINIYSDITFDDIAAMLKQFEMPHLRFSNANDSEKILRLLGVKKIYEDKKKYKKIGYELEKEIEEAYNNNSSGEKLKLLLYKRFIFLVNIGVNNKIFVENFLSLPDDEEESIDIDENYDYYLNSEYIKNGEEYPIDRALYEKSEFYEDIVEELNPVQQNLEDGYQCAIFGRMPLYDRRYNGSFMQLSMSDYFLKNEKDPEDPIDLEVLDEIDIDDQKQYAEFNFDIEEEEFAFYVVYIKKLNDLIDQGKIDLLNVRNRILYMLDDIKYCLFDKKNVNSYYEQSINYELEEDSFEFFATEAKYFIEDVFEGRDLKTIEKLLFISTYYQITKDEEIVKILKRYKDDCRYENYSEIILGKSKGYSKIKK